MNAYHERITELFDEYYRDKTAVKRRTEQANALIEEFIDKHGKRPPASVCSRLATYILLDTLTDSHPDKMSREEYPIMTETQRKRRDEIPSKNVYYERRDYVGFRKTYEKDDEKATGYVKKYPIYNAVSDDVAEEQDAGIDVLTLLEGADLTERQREAIELVFFDDMTQ